MPGRDARQSKAVISMRFESHGAQMLLSGVAEEFEFGPNPGHLRLFHYLPPGLKRGAPLVVVLHGCGQSAAGYGLGAGWFQLAGEQGFAVLAPEQRAINNPRTCFNWFLPADTARGSGEAASIRAMVAFMLDRYGLDPARVFITGLSAGGAMAAAMLAAYPEVFAGGAIIAGVPVGAARNGHEALEAMKAPPARDQRAWADAVRRASAHQGPWPVVSIWHGLDDRIVHPGNGEASVAQWAGLHDVAHAQEETLGNDRHRRWHDGSGRPVLESHAIAGLGHGTPIAPRRGHGIGAPFLLDVDIDSSLQIAQFWGLAAKPARTLPADEAVSLSGWLRRLLRGKTGFS
jgi:poly(hydroxyalkanoate) depolymerase family esterase